MNRAFDGGADAKRCGGAKVRERSGPEARAALHGSGGRGGNDGGLEKALESAVRHAAHPESSTNCALERHAGAGGERARERAGRRLSGRTRERAERGRSARDAKDRVRAC